MGREKPVGQRLLTRDVWPVVPPLLGTLAGLAVLTVGSWRLGLLVFGAAVVGGGLLRALLSPRSAGLLAVRGRVFDSAVMLLLGVAIITVALLR